MENDKVTPDPDNVDPDLDITDGMELVALCFDCLSTIPEYKASKDKFAMSGGSGICPYCSGPFKIIPERAVESLKRRRANGEMINPG